MTKRIADPPRVEILKSSEDPTRGGRLMIGSPSRGTIRMEWHQARIGQVIPVNWSMVNVMESLGGYVTMGYLVADAQNLIVSKFVEGSFDWLLLYEDDMLPPTDAFVKLNEWMSDGSVPVVSGLYCAKSRPVEWLVFRGRGNGSYRGWRRGQRIWVDGVPTGFVLIHGDLLRAMWPDCEEYTVAGRRTRRMFRFPRDLWEDPETHHFRTLMGTSDLDWSTRVMEGGYLRAYAKVARRKYPFLVDGSMLVHHIALSGEIFP